MPRRTATMRTGYFGQYPCRHFAYDHGARRTGKCRRLPSQSEGRNASRQPLALSHRPRQQAQLLVSSPRRRRGFASPAAEQSASPRSSSEAIDRRCPRRAPPAGHPRRHSRRQPAPQRRQQRNQLRKRVGLECNRGCRHALAGFASRGLRSDRGTSASRSCSRQRCNARHPPPRLHRSPSPIYPRRFGRK